MRRIVEENARQRPADRRGRALLMAQLLAFTIADPARAGDGDGPELTPPTEMPVVSQPTRPATPRPAVNAPGRRAVLAVPGGMSTPSRPSAAPEPSTTPLEPISGELSLEAPIEMRPDPAPARARSSTVPGRSSRPLVLESSPMGDSIPLDEPSSPSNPSTKRPTTSRPQPTPAPARRSRLFGLLPAQPIAPAPSASRALTPGRSSSEDLRDDPAAESALKRRVERQAREAVGDRVQSVEVRVIGKDVAIRAHGVRFYQKRAVRKSLESLPALSGLRSVIEVGD